MSEGIPYNQILHERDDSHKLKTSKSRALLNLSLAEMKRKKGKLTTALEKYHGHTEGEMRHYQKKTGRAYSE